MKSAEQIVKDSWRRILQWIRKTQLESELSSLGICPIHRVEYSFDRYIGLHCSKCSMEKWQKKNRKEEAQKTARIKRIACIEKELGDINAARRVEER